jgi:glycosyltransferase involved in cell wall biosynthesis
MKRRILFLEQSTAIGGGVLSLLELARGLDRNEFEPMVLFYWDHPARERFDRAGIQSMSLWRARPGKDPKRSLGLELSVARRVRGIVRRHAVDILHHNTHLYWDRASVLGAAGSSARQVCHIRNFRPFTLAERFCARHVDAFVYTSQAVAQHCLEQGIAPGRGRVIHNPIDSARFANRGDGQRIRRELNLDPADHVVACVGRLDAWKGQDHFLTALAKLRCEGRPVKGLLVGDYPPRARQNGYARKLETMIEQLGLRDHVRLTGFREDVPELLAASDVFVHCSVRPEPFGRVVVEAMAAGTPVIATASGGILDIVRHGETGLLVPCADAVSLAESMARLLDEPATVSRLVESALGWARESFSVLKHVAAVQSLYRGLLEHG